MESHLENGLIISFLSIVVLEQTEGLRQASPSTWARLGARLRIRGKRGVRSVTEPRGLLGSMVSGQKKSSFNFWQLRKGKLASDYLYC